MENTYYLIKHNPTADIDLNILCIKNDDVLFENNINVTVHGNKHIDTFRRNPNPVMDEKERKRAIKHAKERTVTHA